MVSAVVKGFADLADSAAARHCLPFVGMSPVQILDEGNGIPPEELESVFDKFYRAQKGDHVRPGTGLGLAISRGFVEAMQGTISAANRTDRSGAVISIRLPVPATDSALDTAA